MLQTEVHPYFQERELKKFLERAGMVIQAWYPLGHGDKALLEEPLFAELAKKYSKTNAQVILRWHIQAGNIVIPGSKNPAHIKDNFDLFDFSLTGEEMAKITALDKDTRYYTSTPRCSGATWKWCRTWTGRNDKGGNAVNVLLLNGSPRNGGNTAVRFKRNGKDFSGGRHRDGGCSDREQGHPGLRGLFGLQEKREMRV